MLRQNSETSTQVVLSGGVLSNGKVLYIQPINLSTYGQVYPPG
jgi:hypothetical protein